MNIKRTGTKKSSKNSEYFKSQKMIAKVEAIKSNLKASTWHELETNDMEFIVIRNIKDYANSKVTAILPIYFMSTVNDHF